MIEGLFIEMTTAKLKDHLTAKIDHHQAKATWYAEQVKSLRAGVETTNASNDPTLSLAQSQRTHERKVGFFTMLRDNLIPDEVYRLSEEVCVRLDFWERYL